MRHIAKIATDRIMVAFNDGIVANGIEERETDSCIGCSFASMQDETSRCRAINDAGFDCSVQGIIWMTQQ